MGQLFSGRSPVALGGVMAALAVLMGLLNQGMPLFFGLLVPLPLAVAAIWLPLKFAILTALAAILVLGMLVGPLAALGFACQYALMGVIMGAAVRLGKRYAVIFVAATLAQVTGMALYLLVQLGLMGFDLAAFLQTFTEMEQETLDAMAAMNLYDTAAAGGLSAAEMTATIERIVHLTTQLLPAFYVLIYMGFAAVDLLLLYALCQRLGSPAQVPVPRFDAVLMPPAVIVPFILAWIGLLAERHFENQVLWIVAANVMVIGAACMAMDGFSYVVARLKFTEKPPLWQFFYLMVALLMGWYLVVMFAVIGIFDSIADYRQLRTGKGAGTE